VKEEGPILIARENKLARGNVGKNEKDFKNRNVVDCQKARKSLSRKFTQ
jgi:hypothetical protein